MQAIKRKRREEREKMLEEMIAAEREKDPDALDEEIIQKVQKELTKRKLKGENPLDET